MMNDSLDKIFLQRDYANQVGNRLNLFTIQSTSPYKANFRCPVCGDSQKNKYKKRGYFIEQNNSIFFYCHNGCGSQNLDGFLKDNFSDLYNSYKFDLIKDKYPKKEDDDLSDFGKINLPIKQNIDLSEYCLEDEAYHYLEQRMIPEDKWNDIYYTDHFYKLVNRYKEKFPKEKEDKIDKRIVLPIRDSNKQIYGLIGRTITNSKMRYFTTIFDKDKPKLFGLDRLNRNEPLFVTEGPIDSLFLQNAIAICGLDGGLNDLNIGDMTIILDNEPRSKDVINAYKKYINKDYKMFIWPQNIEEKDINDLILSGFNHKYLSDLIKKNTFSGIKLKTIFNDWKKI